jgi:hypothetical protein
MADRSVDVRCRRYSRHHLTGRGVCNRPEADTATRAEIAAVKLGLELSQSAIAVTRQQLEKLKTAAESRFYGRKPTDAAACYGTTESRFCCSAPIGRSVKPVLCSY